MGVKKQHFVPRVYLKNWETRVSSKKEPRKYFQGIYCFSKDDLKTGDGKNKDSVLWKSRLYNINYKRSFMIPSCPKIEEDYITQIEDKLTSRGIVAYYKDKMLDSRNDLKKYFFQLDEWNFKYKESMNQAGKKAMLNDIKSIHSYVLENALDDVVEKKWQATIKKFIDLMETMVPLNGVDEIRRIDKDVVVEMVKMVIFLMNRNPDFDYFGILPKLVGVLKKPLNDIAGEGNTSDVDAFLQLQRDVVWLKELYNGIFEVNQGYFYKLKTAAQNTLQVILFKIHEGQGHFITSDKPAFIHSSMLEAVNMNSIICPLTPQYLVMITQGEKNNLKDVNFRKADNDLIRKFNMIILNHSKNIIISDFKYLGYIL